MISTFRDETAFLSNMYETPVEFQGLIYPSSENAYQAMKCADPNQYQEFLAISPAESKKKGRKIKLRPDWEEVKYPFMRSILDAKFKDTSMRKKLLCTGHEILIEGNTWHDNYWGICTCDKCKDKEKHNYLGELLMRTRNVIRTDISSTPDLFTIYQGEIIRRSDGNKISCPAVLYDKDTYTVLKIGDESMCIGYLMQMQGPLLNAATMFTWNTNTLMMKYKACEDMNHIMLYTGSLPKVLGL